MQNVFVTYIKTVCTIYFKIFAPRICTAGQLLLSSPNKLQIQGLQRETIFCSFDSIYVEYLRSKIFLVLVENSPRQTQCYVSQCIRRIRQDSCGIFFICAYFLRILRINLNTFRVFRDDFVYRKQPYFCYILHVSLNIFRIFSEYSKILSGYSPQTFKYFPHIHRIPRKNGEYTENFYFQQCPMKLKGHYFEKI